MAEKRLRAGLSAIGAYAVVLGVLGGAAACSSGQNYANVVPNIPPDTVNQVAATDSASADSALDQPSIGGGTATGTAKPATSPVPARPPVPLVPPAATLKPTTTAPATASPLPIAAPGPLLVGIGGEVCHRTSPTSLSVTAVMRFSGLAGWTASSLNHTVSVAAAAGTVTVTQVVPLTAHARTPAYWQSQGMLNFSGPGGARSSDPFDAVIPCTG